MSPDGSVTGPAGYGPAGGARPGNGLAVAGVLCGLAGLLYFAVVLGPLAIVLGGIGWSRARRGARYKGMSIAAVVLGVLDVVLWLVLVAVASRNGSPHTSVG